MSAEPRENATPPLLEVAELRFAYGDRPVLDGLDLRLDSGEIFALLGPNGAGKTTLARLVCGRLRPAGGRIRLFGEPPRSARRQLGLVPQEIALYPHLTAHENVRAFARLAGVARRQATAAAAQALRLCGLADQADRPVHALSGGYRRRANIAAAIAHGPRLLLLDEPTAGIDLDARQSILQVIRDLARTGMGILLITHDLEQAEQTAHRIGLLLDGRLAAQGSASALVAQQFGAARELEVTLAAEPDAAQRALLTARRLAPADNARHWIGQSSHGLNGADALGRALEDAGLTVQALCVRRPTLGSLIRRLSGGTPC